MDAQHIKSFRPTAWALNNKTAVYIFTIIITIVGLVTYIRIPKEQFPDLVIPTIFVSVIYPGATPEDIETLITKPIEKQLKSVNDLKRITSRSIQDLALIQIEFNTNIQASVAKQRVTDAVDLARNELPTDLDNDPLIQEVSFSEFPIMNINIAGDLPLVQLDKYADEIKDNIETFPEITRLDKIGAPKREIQIDVDLYKMASNSIAFSDIERAVAAENVNISGGELKVNELRRTLRITGQFRGAKELENILIKPTRGGTMFLKDIATVRDGFEEKQDFARMEGKTVITLNVIKRAGENLIGAADKINGFLAEYKRTKLPEGATIEVTGDTSRETKIQLNDLINTVIIGFVLVLIVLTFFMGLQSAFFVALAVPLSALMAFIFMPSLDFTLNVIVLFSLLLAIGIIVDDAIVVIENTHRILNSTTLSVKESAKAAAGEVFIPVLAGTLTTIAPFVPLLFWPGIVGKFMRFLPITLILTLFASLFVAFIMNTVFATDTMKKHDNHRRNWRTQLVLPTLIFLVLGFMFSGAGTAGLGNFLFLLAILTPVNYFLITPAATVFQTRTWPWFIRGYKRTLTFLTRGAMPVVTLLATIVLLFVSVGAFFGSNPKIEFFPTGQPNFAYIYLKMPVGTDATTTDSITRMAEERVFQVIGENNPNVESVISNVGIGAGNPQDPDRVVSPHKGKVSVAFVGFGERVNGFNTSEALNAIREKMKDIPVAEISVEAESNGPPVGKAVNIEISGDDFAVLEQLQVELLNNIQTAKILGIEELLSDLVRNKPEILVTLDENKMQLEGLSRAQVALELRTALFGKEISKFRDLDDDAPIMLRLSPEYRTNVEYLLNMPMTFLDMGTGQLRQVPISSFASMEYKSAFATIVRKNQRRVVTLSSNVIEGANANQIVADIQQVINGMKIPEGYSIKMTGAQEDQEETSSFLSVAFLGALALMFLILVTQFNSASKPFIIFSTVLFSLIGIFLGFTIFARPLSIVMTGVGIFALAGIVIRNGILLLEFTDELQDRGVPFKEAVIEAGATRITPVFLTAICAILGLIPLAIGLNINFATLLSDFEPHFYLGGDNVAFWGPLAWTMIYGLVVATFLTLLVVPCMLLIYNGIGNGFRRLGSRLSGKKTVPAPLAAAEGIEAEENEH